MYSTTIGSCTHKVPSCHKRLSRLPPNMEQKSIVRVDAVWDFFYRSLDYTHRSRTDPLRSRWVITINSEQTPEYSHHSSSTLIDSTPGVLYAWDEFRKQYTHLPGNIAHLTHGRRLTDTLREHCKITDETELEVSCSDQCT